MVLFLAQNPKRIDNVHAPLTGTQSGKRFKQWVKLLGCQEYMVYNASRKLGRVSHKDYDYETVAVAVKCADRFVALGKYACGLFDRLGVRYFELPHPSGLSRKLNDKAALAHQLWLCSVYLKSAKRRKKR